MLKKLLTIGTALLIINLSGCNYITGGADNSEPPMALTDIKPEQKFAKLWNVKVGNGDSGNYLKLKPLVLADKIITVDSSGLLSATKTINGNQIWQKSLAFNVTQGVAGNNNKIFVSTAGGELVALNPNNGELLWQARVAKNILNNPTLSKDSKELYLQTTDGTLYSFNANNGKENWEYNVLVPDLTLYSTSSPKEWKDTVVAGFANGKIMIFDKKSGMPKWDYQVGKPEGISSIQRMIDVNADLIIDNDYLYAVSYQGRVVALDLITGKRMWQRKLSSTNNMWLSSKYLYLSDMEGAVWALNRNNGKVLWKQPNLRMRDLSGTSFASNTVLVGDYAGYLHGLSTEHGDFTARVKLSNSGIRVAPQVKNGIIYILDNSGKLAAYKLSGLKA